MTALPPLLVITPPPTPNGRLHIGHVGGPFLRADVLIRLNRYLAERPAAHMSHIDVYQSYVHKRAEELDRDIIELREEMAGGIQADYKAFGIDHEHMVDNTTPEYLAFLDGALEFVLPRLDLSWAPAHRCTTCGIVAHEAFIKGHCGTCLHQTYANVCENCTLPQTLESMIDPWCGRCGGTSFEEIEARQTSINIAAGEIEAIRREVWPLCQDNRRLREMFVTLSAHTLPVTYPVGYGVFPPTLDGALNPWVEIYFAHLYGLLCAVGIDTSGPFDAAVEQLASTEERPEVVYFFGVDNSYWYAFLFPYLARKTGVDALWPSALNANFFMQLNGAKVSSSRGNVRWAADVLDDAPVRTLRTNLAASCPEFAVSNFVARPALRVDGADGRTLEAGALRPARGEIGQRLLDRLVRLTDPTVFSLEGLLNALEEGLLQADRLRGAGPLDEAVYVESLIHGVLDALDME